MIFASSTVCIAALRSGLVASAMSAELLERQQLVLEIVRTAHVELLHRRAIIVQQGKKLDLAVRRLTSAVSKVRLELNALQLQPVQIHLRQIAGVAGGSDSHPVRDPNRPGYRCAFCQHRLGLQNLHEGVAKVEQQAALLIGGLGLG